MSNSVVPMGPRGKTIASVIKYGLGIGVLAVAAPILMSALTGLVLLIAIALVFFVATTLSPVVALKVSNFAMNKFIEEVWENPVNTRRNREIEKQEALEKEGRDLQALQAAVTGFQRKVQGLIKQYPDEAERFREQEQNLVDLLAGRYEAYQRSQQSLVAYQKMTERVSAIWEVAEAATKATRLAGSQAKRNALQQIADDESIKAADQKMDEAFASLAFMRKINADGQTKIENKPSVKLERDQDGIFTIPVLTKTGVAVG